MPTQLITGSEGFLGSHLRKLYPEADCIDISLGNDICDLFPKHKKYEQIFHLAARHHIQDCEDNAKECIRVNCWGTLNLIKTFPDARIISISTCLAENVNSVYGATKLFTESLGKLHKNYLSVRLYNIFGEGQRLETGFIVPKLIDTYLKHLPLSIYGDGTQARDFTYVGDVVENLKILMDSNEIGLTHLGYGDPITINHLIHMIYGRMPEVAHIPPRKIDTDYSKSPIPCFVKYGREEGIRRTVDWFKEQYFV